MNRARIAEIEPARTPWNPTETARLFGSFAANKIPTVPRTERAAITAYSTKNT